MAASKSKAGITEKQQGLLAGLFEECYAPSEHSKDMRKASLGWLFNGRTSVKLLTKPEGSAAIDWLLDKDSEAGDYRLHKHAPEEAQRIYRAAMEAQGQQPLAL